MQRYVSDIKDDISREVELDELRQLQSSMKEAAQEIEESVSKQVNLIEDEVQQAESETRKTVEEAVQPVAGINLMHSLNPPDYPEEETAKPEDETPEPAPQAEPGSGAKSSGSTDKQA
jgi:sec-independent protein translocase protein TatB